MQDKISVIVPIYNVEKYLKYCLNSILEQTYENLEIILVDDGATDGCAEICDEYKLKDGRIKVIHKTNGGLADARNTGLKQATGEYISFIDSDDYIYPTFYEELYNIMKKYNSDISECEFMRINVDNIENCKNIIDAENNKRNTMEVIEENIEALDHLYGPRLHPYLKKVVVWNKLYKKSVLENIQFPVGKLHEDEYTTYQILYKSSKIASTNRILHGYMQTNNSIMRQEIKQKRIEDNLDAYYKSSEFFNKNSEPEIEIKSRRRYLENCVELAGKVHKSNGKDKQEQLEYITNLFMENYTLHINKIEEVIKNEKEIEIVKLLKKAYEDTKMKEILPPEYWEELEKIINKE